MDVCMCVVCVRSQVELYSACFYSIDQDLIPYLILMPLRDTFIHVFKQIKVFVSVYMHFCVGEGLAQCHTGSE